MNLNVLICSYLREVVLIRELVDFIETHPRKDKSRIVALGEAQLRVRMEVSFFTLAMGNTHLHEVGLQATEVLLVLSISSIGVALHETWNHGKHAHR